MPPETAAAFGALIVTFVICVIIFTYRYEKKKDAGRRDKAMMRGWRYESAKGNSRGFTVEGYGDSLQWRFEERRSGGKNDQRPLYFLVEGIRYDYGVFYFGNKAEIDLLQKPFMQYILKLGAKMAPKESDGGRVEALILLKDAQAVDIPDSSGKWKCGALATHPEFALKVMGAGLQAEYDSLSLQGILNSPPSVMLTSEGLEIKWPVRGCDAGKMEVMIDASVRIMGILAKSVRG